MQSKGNKLRPVVATRTVGPKEKLAKTQETLDLNPLLVDVTPRPLDRFPSLNTYMPRASLVSRTMT